ncbi:hypothetical protein FRC18_004034 [Serendipita sp. 400]|nr:hypothetical protein FRC18_004034 [Serendipita sp. 400]
MDRFFQSYCTLPTYQVPQAPQQMVFLGDQGHDESEYMEALVQASAFDPYNQQSATYRRHVPESSSPYHMWETNQRSSDAGMHKNMEYQPLAYDTLTEQAWFPYPHNTVSVANTAEADIWRQVGPLSGYDISASFENEYDASCSVDCGLAGPGYALPTSQLVKPFFSAGPQDHRDLRVEDRLSFNLNNDGIYVIQNGLPHEHEREGALIMSNAAVHTLMEDSGGCTVGVHLGTNLLDVVQKSEDNMIAVNGEEDPKEESDDQWNPEKNGYQTAVAVIEKGLKKGVKTTEFFSAFPATQAPKQIPTKGDGKQKDTFKCQFEAFLTREGVLKWELLGKPCGEEIKHGPSLRRHICEQHLGVGRSKKGKSSEMRFKARLEKHYAAVEVGENKTREKSEENEEDFARPSKRHRHV